MNRYLEIYSHKGILKKDEVPVLSYPDFNDLVDQLLINTANHCVTYFAVPFNEDFQCFCLISCDDDHCVKIFSHYLFKNQMLDSITERHFQFHIFEREMHEKYQIGFKDHPWLKPVRFPSRGLVTMNNYPFYSIEGEELHEVGVGPVHAGVIEPGHFRFICHGEKVLHLEMHLGYQHRGIEELFISKESILQRIILAESIAGDTVAGHAITHASLMEVFASVEVGDDISIERVIALELERIANHIGDTAALCTDTAYQFGQVVCEALRTVVINTTQAWCGNRFSKGLVRVGGTHYPLNQNVIKLIGENLKDVMERFEQITSKIFSNSSVLNRFEGTGKVTPAQAVTIGAVGIAARSSNLKRDVRSTFPVKFLKYEPVVFKSGDVHARGLVRRDEVRKSYKIINDLLEKRESISFESHKPLTEIDLSPESIAFALTEGWRGEICHIAVTDLDGKIIHYTIKDPSMHNWMALALAVRNEEISDFPLCNKSFNLSYCGHDL